MLELLSTPQGSLEALCDAQAGTRAATISGMRTAAARSRKEELGTILAKLNERFEKFC